MDAARKNVRSSNFELLRIISMILIIAHHYAVHSGFSFDAASMSLHRFFVQFLSSGGKIGVNLFVLISGYFLLDSTFRIKKAIRLFAEVLFYSAGITVFCFVTGLAPFSFNLLIRSFLPLSSSMSVKPDFSAEKYGIPAGSGGIRQIPREYLSVFMGFAPAGGLLFRRKAVKIPLRN